MNLRVLKGTIRKGAGVATSSLAPIFKDVQRLSGLALIPGTVNVQLSHWYPGHLDIVLLAHEYGHHEHVFLERCQLFGKPGLILRTSTNYHGPAVLEVMSTERIKQSHSVDVGSEIEVTVFDRGGRAIEVIPPP